MLASAGGRRHALRCTIAARQEFAGYWEYMLDEAIFTAPAHPSWGGAGLIGAAAERDAWFRGCLSRDEKNVFEKALTKLAGRARELIQQEKG